MASIASKKTKSVFAGIRDSFGGKKKNLQQVNEKLYEQNLDLAIRNKTLSLLYRLYEIATDSLEINILSSRLVDNTADALSLPFVSILLVDKKENCLSIAASASNSVPKTNTVLQEKRTSLLLSTVKHKNNLCLQALLNGEKKQTPHFFHTMQPFFSTKAFSALKQQMHIETALIYPLQTARKNIGVLVIGLDKAYDDLTIFDKDSITNLVNVFTVALDKSIVYEDLKRANSRLQILDRQKTEFLSIASHQLRTPLSIIKGYIELISDGAYGHVSKKLDAVLKDMADSNERLVKLVDDFLNISRIEQGRTKYSFKEQSIAPIIQSVVDELLQRAEQANIKISWKGTKKGKKVYIDDDKIRHIIFNYVDNAIKYSEKGTIKILVDEENDGINVRVVDEGFGFGPEDEAAFFQKFYRGKNVEGTNVNGTGLGIYVCRQFVEAHGGHVWAHSPGLGKGSEFGFWIPMQKTKTHQMIEKMSSTEKQQIVNQYAPHEDLPVVAQGLLPTENPLVQIDPAVSPSASSA